MNSGRGGPHQPPGPARWLARWASSRDDLSYVLADLDEHFQRVGRERGPAAARRWYWWQVIRGVFARATSAAGGLLRLPAGLGVAARALLRRPLHALGVAGTLALGLGTLASVGTVSWKVWLQPLDVPDPDRVVRIYERQPPELSVAGALLDDPGRSWVSPPLLEDLRRREWSTLEAVAGVSRGRRSWIRPEGTEGLSTLLVSTDLDGVLGLVPTEGRWFGSDEDSPEVVLTRSFFQRAFGGDVSSLPSRRLELDGVSHVPVGVVELPAGVTDPVDILLPLRFGPDELSEGMRGARYLEVLARMRAGSEPAVAEEEVGSVIRALGSTHPAHRGWDARVVRLDEDLFAPYRGLLSLLLAAGCVFLLLAGANVIGLVAARRAESREDHAVRRALGATELHLLTESALEGLLLGALAGAVGWAGASALLVPIRLLVPADVPRVAEATLDPGIGGAVLVLGGVTGALVGLAAYGVSRGGAATGSGRRGASSRGLAARRTLVVAQMALTTLLVVAGVGILERIVRLQAVASGFDGAGIQVSHLAFDGRRHPTDGELSAVWEAVVEHLEGRGMEAGFGTNPPVAGSTMRFGFRPDPDGEQFFAQYHSVSPRYFDLLSLDLLEGRAFDPSDDAAGEPVVIVNEALARAHFPGVSPLGRRIQVVGTMRRIVGVAESARHFGPDEPAPEEVYVPARQDPWAVGHLLIRTEREDLGDLVEEAVRAADPTVDPPSPARFSRFVARWYAPLRLQLVVVGVLGGTGLTLALLGLYALTVAHVEGRRREIGIRMALGASGAGLFGRILGGGLAMAAVGTLVGLGVWALVHPIVAQLVPATQPGPLSTLAVGVGVPLVAAVATLRPAWRSVRVDPRTTLHAA